MLLCMHAAQGQGRMHACACRASELWLGAGACARWQVRTALTTNPVCLVFIFRDARDAYGISLVVAKF